MKQNLNDLFRELDSQMDKTYHLRDASTSLLSSISKAIDFTIPKVKIVNETDKASRSQS